MMPMKGPDLLTKVAFVGITALAFMCLRDSMPYLLWVVVVPVALAFSAAPATVVNNNRG
jgi:hypothetical protein